MQPPAPHAAPPDDDPLLTWRRRTVDRLLRLLVLIGLPLIIVDAVVEIAFRNWFILVWNLASWSLILALALARRLDHRLRSAALIAILLLGSMAGLRTFGLNGISVALVLMPVVLALLLLGRRAGIVTGVLGAGGVALISLGFGLEIIPYPYALARSAAEPLVLLNSWLLLVGIGSVLALMIGSLVSALQASLRSSQRAMGELERVNADLEATVERRTAEVRQAAALLEATQRAARVGGFTLDPDTNAVLWTDELYRIHEVPPDCPLDLPLYDRLFPGTTGEKLLGQIERLAVSGQPFELEVPTRTLGGRPIWVRVSAMGTSVAGRPQPIGAVQDITAHKEAELQAAQQLRYAEALARCSRTLLTPRAELTLRETLDAAVAPIRAALDAGRLTVTRYPSHAAGEQTLFTLFQLVACAEEPGMPPQQPPSPEAARDMPPELNIWSPGGAPFNGPVTGRFPEHPVFQAYLDATGVRSLFIQTLDVSGRWWGHIAVTDHACARSWDSGAVQLLQTAGEMIVTFLERKEAELVQRQLRDDLERARDAAEAAAGARAAFLATMSHEIRTPLNAVIGMAALLADTPLSDEQRRCVATISTGGQALLAVIDDILDFSRIEAGHTELDAEPFALPSCLASAVDLVAHQARGKGLALSCMVAPEVPRAVIGDEGRLRQVVLNLLANAVKFTARGEVALEATARPHADGMASVRIAVRDTGPGIAPERLKQIFEPFVQGDGGTARRFGGTGLGLAISREVVSQMGGAITVDSTPGVGSTFTIALPLPLAPAATFPPPPDPAPAVPPLRVLVAEDNPINQAVTRQILTRMGHAVTVAADGHEVLARLTRERFDVVLMDVQMPGLDGEETTRRIRRLDLGSARPHIIALTASAVRGDRERMLRAGMDDYLSKPVRPADLERALARAVRPGPSPVVGAPTAVLPPPASTAEAAQPLVAWAEIDRLMHSLELTEAETRATLARMFADMLPPQLDAIDAAIACDDTDLLRREAHRLRGGCLQLGARAMAALCDLLESDPARPDAAAIAARLRACYAETRAVLQADRR